MTTPDDGVVFMSARFGFGMNNKTFILNKTQQKVRDAKREATAKPKPKFTPGQPVEGYLEPPPKPRAKGEPDVLLALEGVKELLEQFGSGRRSGWSICWGERVCSIYQSC